MFSFDYEYWGIFKGALEKGEDVVQDLACQYKLSMNDLCNIEAFQNGTLEDVKGYCATANLQTIREQNYILAHAHYVGIQEQ